jgi:hypothetical protein
VAALVGCGEPKAGDHLRVYADTGPDMGYPNMIPIMPYAATFLLGLVENIG